MKKYIWITGIITALGLVNCNSSSEEAKELLSQILTVVGIPQDMIVNICQDDDGNGFCSSIELGNISSIKNSWFKKIILGEDNSYELKNYDPNKKIIMQLQSDDVQYNDGNFSLEYKGTTTELSILQSMVDAEDISEEDTVEVKKMEGKDTFDEILLSSLMKNLNRYMNNNMRHKDARDSNLKELGRVFKEDIPLKNLSTLIQKECNGDIDCRRELIKSFPVNLDTEEQDIYTIAQEQRRVKLLNDKLIEEFSCEAEDRKIIRHYGFEDLFNLKNRDELTHPSKNVTTQIRAENLINYDNEPNGKFFAEEVNRLPRKIKKGMFYIGLKRTGDSLNRDDKIHIGRYSTDTNFNATLLSLANRGWSHQAISRDDPTTDIYYTNFKNIQLNDKNETLIDYLSKRNYFDIVVEKDTAVDFISVATCSEKDPVAEIKQTLNVFSCKDDERLIKIIGGTVDAFAEDNDEKETTPSSAMTNSINNPTIGYDELADNKIFIDTLNRPLDLTITDAQFSVGIKPMPRLLYQNDIIYLGNYSANKYASFRLYGNSENSVFNKWKKDIRISNGERVIQANLFDLNLTKGGESSIFDMINATNSLLDILIQNDTQVDFSYLNLCVK
jgi:hypothetical protein